MRRQRNAKIVATLGPASGTPEIIRRLVEAGADVFRLNFSHGTHEDHRKRYDIIRSVEEETGRPIGVLADLQGPKLRLGTFAEGRVQLATGDTFALDLKGGPGTRQRVSLPHPEIFQALAPGVQLLLDDGKVRLEVETSDGERAQTRVVVGGPLSDRKGVSVVGAVLPLSPLTPKDRVDLDYALELGVDWIALSFVQKPEDVEELRSIVRDRAGIMSKLEKPAAIEHLNAIVALSDAVMVARGDLGVEMAPEQVPPIQRRIVRACRQAGKPSIVATQMLESMIGVPTPTRAEVSDVASAIYHGADAVMLSAESASGQFPLEAVTMMNRIITVAENDHDYYRPMSDAARPAPGATIADVICAGIREATRLLPIAAVVTYTTSGSSSLRASRERPAASILSMATSRKIARRLTLGWGLHSVEAAAVASVDEMSIRACEAAIREGFAKTGDTIVVATGTPVGVSGTTNTLKILTA
ncbi:pyruvate kinase [Bradyrhizobium jicamae]|uniref:pyruvate kinase n=1 Tax=Bradyrhizobium jicamae TaxID=280332 RepID=UPI001BAA844A|nr:pyruvate kinase [Bradyrhizobium jicamae]MBR0934378.1 pyruvate kinase [Bradyrhizobium jicamae]